MFNTLLLLDLPDLSSFTSNPIDTLGQVLTSSLGFFGYALVLLLLVALVYIHTSSLETCGTFIVLFGAVASVLYPITISIIMLVLGIGLIFGGVMWKAFFKSRGEY